MGDVRRIAVLSGTRADYGLLKPLLRVLLADQRCELQLIVSGSHLSAAHGSTVTEIEADGIPIAARIPIWSDDDSDLAAAIDVGSAVGAFASRLTELEPAVVVVLGDRLEALAMALAATVIGVPVAHIHGGEVTEGAMDDALRHAITKLSYLHFVTTEEHRRRVIQLGEADDRVYNFGAPVLDAIAELTLLTAIEIDGRFGVAVTPRTVLLTFHPAAFDTVPSLDLLRELLSALEQVDDVTVITTGTNTDIGSDLIREELATWVADHPGIASHVESFGQLGYLSAMKLAGVVAGNSSSTVLEAPLLGTPSVLVGDRQQGRPLSSTVLHPEPTASSIRAALERALTVGRSDESVSVFGAPGFALQAAEQLVTREIPSPPRKSFVDTSPSPTTPKGPHD